MIKPMSNIKGNQAVEVKIKNFLKNKKRKF